MAKKLLFALVFFLGSSLASATTPSFVTKHWSGEVLSGMFAGQVGVGTFTYDQSLINNSGYESIGAADGLTLTFHFLGQDFTEMNDVEYAAFPLLGFLDGGIDSLNYFVVSGINNQNVIDFGTFALTKNLDGSYYGEISVTAVPEPETYALMLAGLGLVGFAARRKSMR